MDIAAIGDPRRDDDGISVRGIGREGGRHQRLAMAKRSSNCSDSGSRAVTVLGHRGGATRDDLRYRSELRIDRDVVQIFSRGSSSALVRPEIGRAHV